MIESLYRFVMKYVYRIKSRQSYSGLPKLEPGYRKEIKNFWKAYRIRPSLYDYRMYKSKGLRNDPRLIPNEVWHGEIEPRLVNFELLPGFQDKNYMDLHIGEEHSPSVIARCISGTILDADFNLRSWPWFENELENAGEIVIKPSLNSGGGRGVQIVEGDAITLNHFEQYKIEYCGDFVVQRRINQHDFFAKFNTTSTNTIRLVSMFLNGDFRVLSAFLRVGAPGSQVDNVSSGGVLVQIDVNAGQLTDKGLDHDLNQVTELSTMENFAGESIPGWSSILSVVQSAHCRLAHFKLINWDITVDSSGVVKIIEYNLIDSSIDWHQVNIGPIFGDSTERILREVLAS